ncbi:MAG: SGNH/GDSL hydrolase family protein [Elusimicrobia bacterium]|nr:SGNH/GDSL hydrolase family protein [Elusimicrobiota bacterium]
MLELALRSFGPVLPGYYQTGPLIEPDPDLGWRHVPSSVVWFRTRDFTSRAEVNAQGHLGPAVPVARTDALRVMVLGDSFAGATQLPSERSVAGLLPEHIGRAVEVINEGVSGYGTDQEILVLERDGPLLRPDVVVLLFTVSNDVFNNDPALQHPGLTYPKPHFDLGPAGELTLVPLPRNEPSPADRIRRWLAGSSLLWVIKTGVIDPLTGTQTDPGYHRRLLEVLEEPSGEWERAWQLTDRLVQRIAGTAEAIGALPLLVIVPDACQVHSRLCPEPFTPRAVPQARLRAVAERSGMRVVDLLPELRQAAAQGETLYFPSDLHWNEAGHAAAAAAIARSIPEALKRPSPDRP